MSDHDFVALESNLQGMGQAQVIFAIRIFDT
jgi:hypothetical protein